MNNSIELNLDLNFINCSTTALIREYLARKGLRNTLETFDEENEQNNTENISSRSKLVEYLSIQNIYEKNKTLKNPFKTILELILSYHSASFKKDKSIDKKSSETMGSKKSFYDKSYFDEPKIKMNNLKIDDVDESELTDGNDKRVSSKNLEEDSKNLRNLRAVTKPKPNSTTIKRKESEKETKFISDEVKKPAFLTQEEKPSKKELDFSKPTQKTDNKKDEPFNFQNFLAKPDSNKGLSKAPSNSNLNQASSEYTVKQIDFETAKNLKTLLFGNVNQAFNDEWKIQSLKFCDIAKLKFGIVQKKGGPCGVLAAIQSYILLELIYGDRDEPPKDTNLIFNVTKKDRSKALAKGLSRLFWKCSDENEAIVAIPTSKSHFPPSGKYRTDGFTETLNLLSFTNYQNLENYLIKNIEIFEQEGNYGCIMVLYSAIFSRTINKIAKDMDDPNSKLMGMHGYCTMEMVNLLIHGRAVSNVFNDSMMLDQLELRGPNFRNEMGLLSLFEHYKSCEVGSYYKTPKYPIWVVCSESHFSVLFALRKDILNDWKAETKFDLYYYDGLAGQNEQIRLTISSKQYETGRPSFFDEIYKNKKIDKDKELIPPLELVIRTKWKNAHVDWNSTDPIL